MSSSASPAATAGPAPAPAPPTPGQARALRTLQALAAAALALSLGVKIALAVMGPGHPGEAAKGAAAVAPRTEALRAFLAPRVGPLAPIATGWRWRADGAPALQLGPAGVPVGCRYFAYPSGVRGTMDMSALARARPGDRIAYVYKGRVTPERPTLEVGLDIVAYLATKPFHAGHEPGYVVLIARDCPALPDLPWEQLTY